MTGKLLQLQENIYNYYKEEDNLINPEYTPHISFSTFGELYEILYYGEGYDDDYTIPSSELEDGYNYAFCALQDFLIENPEKVCSLVFTGPDSGANGTRNWDFSRIIQSEVIFPALQSFKVALTDPGDHNQSIIGVDYDEEGMIARLVSKMPILKTLQVPSSPDSSFFELDKLAINRLIVQAGYNHQSFIKNLAQSGNLKNLRSLDYTDISEMNGSVTPFDDYRNLFESDVFAKYEYFHFKLRNSCLDENQLKELQEIRKIQFLCIDSRQGKYIRI